MPFLKSLPDNAGPPAIFTKYPAVYKPWAEMSEALMNGPSPLSEGERELILAFAAGAAGCRFVCVAHSAVAYSWGIEAGLVDKLIEDFDAAPVSSQLRPLLAFVRKLSVTPGDVSQEDVSAVLDAGWNEQAVQDAAAITARAAFMQRLVHAHGFTPMTPEAAAQRAEKRKALGYVNLFPEFRDAKAG